jgi:hypothetical protein
MSPGTLASRTPESCPDAHPHHKRTIRDASGVWYPDAATPSRLAVTLDYHQPIGRRERLAELRNRR